MKEAETSTSVTVVVGPTASGKSAFAFALAKEQGAEILCVDSRTVYRGMDIGTAKPKGERQSSGALLVDGVPHWGLDLADPSEVFSLDAFLSFGRPKVQEILSRGIPLVLVGGTGLWMDALVFDFLPPKVAPARVLRRALEELSLEALQDRYRRLDPDGATRIDLKNPRRLIRAIEVVEATGLPFFSQQKKGPHALHATWFFLDIPKDELEGRIRARVDAMMAEGLLEEVRTLVAGWGLEAPGLQTIGYQEFFPYLRGEISLSDAVEQVKTHTLQYAKRQRTWWRKREELQRV